jgi:hypothetical protein
VCAGADHFGVIAYLYVETQLAAVDLRESSARGDLHPGGVGAV